jgi:hypothetical protein
MKSKDGPIFNSSGGTYSHDEYHEQKGLLAKYGLYNCFFFGGVGLNPH